MTPGEVTAWIDILHKAIAAAPNSQIFVLFSTVGHNASAENLYRFRNALGELAMPWPQNLSVPEASSASASALDSNGGALAQRTRRWGSSTGSLEAEHLKKDVVRGNRWSRNK